MKDDKQFVDRLLDCGLNRLGAAEPETGLEIRILARLRARASTPRPFARSRQFGLALAAVIVLSVSAAAFFFYATKDRGLAPQAGSHGKSLPDRGLFAPQEKPTVNHRTIDRGYQMARTSPRHKQRAVATTALEVRRAEAAPRLSVFPSPTPMTEEEKLLVAYSRYGPPPSLDPFKEQMERLVQLGLAPASKSQPVEDQSRRRNQ